MVPSLELSWPDAAETAFHSRKLPASAGTPRLLDLAQGKAQGDAAAAWQEKGVCTAATGSVPGRNAMTSGPDAAVKPILCSWHVLLIQFWWPVAKKLLVTVLTGNFKDLYGYNLHSKTRLGGLSDLRSTCPFVFCWEFPSTHAPESTCRFWQTPISSELRPLPISACPSSSCPRC